MHRFVGLLIGLLVLIDAFFIAYAVGINVRRTTLVDPGLPVQVKTVQTTPAPPKEHKAGPVINGTSSAKKAKNVKTDVPGSTTGNTRTTTDSDQP